MNQKGNLTPKEKEDSLVPDDPRPEWEREDDEIEGKEPELAEIEEDTLEQE